MPDPAEPSGQFMQFLRGCGIKCEARVGQWCPFDKMSGIAEWDSFHMLDFDDELKGGNDSMSWDEVLCIV
jgi:hypothetical protein